MIAGGMHPEPPALFFERASRAGLPQIPATYVQLEHDRALAPAAQVQQARNANARLVSLPSGHTVMLSRPEALAQLLGELTARDGV